MTQEGVLHWVITMFIFCEPPVVPAVNVLLAHQQMPPPPPPPPPIICLSYAIDVKEGDMTKLPLGDGMLGTLVKERVLEASNELSETGNYLLIFKLYRHLKGLGS